MRRGELKGALKGAIVTNRTLDWGTPEGAIWRGDEGSEWGVLVVFWVQDGEGGQHGKVNSSSPSTISTFSSFKDRSNRRFSSRSFSMVRAVLGSSGSTTEASRFVSSRKVTRVYWRVSVSGCVYLTTVERPCHSHWTLGSERRGASGNRERAFWGVCYWVVDIRISNTAICTVCVLLGL